MKRSTKIIAAVVLSFGVVGGAIAYGKHKYSDPEGRANYAVGYISKELNLDAGQQDALNALKKRLLETRADMKKQVPSARDEIRSMIAADQFDQSKALDMVNNKTLLINDSAPELVALLGNFLDSLNVEQKAEILEFMDRKSRRHGH